MLVQSQLLSFICCLVCKVNKNTINVRKEASVEAFSKCSDIVGIKHGNLTDV